MYLFLFLSVGSYSYKLLLIFLSLYVFILAGLLNFHILNILLVLEFGMLMNLLVLGLSAGSSALIVLMSLEFFTFSVCEACLGISILIKSVRMKGNDYSK